MTTDIGPTTACIDCGTIFSVWDSAEGRCLVCAKPIEDRAFLQQCLDECTSVPLGSGHVATFRGVSGQFSMTGGPDEFTDYMARKAAVFFWALAERDKAKFNDWK